MCGCGVTAAKCLVCFPPELSLSHGALTPRGEAMRPRGAGECVGARAWSGASALDFAPTKLTQSTDKRP